MKKLGPPVGNWLTAEEGQQLVGTVHTDTLRWERQARARLAHLLCSSVWL